MSTGSTLRIGLVGHPVAHSWSPTLHQAALAHAGLEGSYELFDVVSSDQLVEHAHRLRTGALHGLNVTVPHKLAAARLADILSPAAAAVGAVNTLAMEGTTLVGHNTDAIGLAAATRPLMTSLADVAVVIGAGGAARAAVVAALELGAQQIRVVNRTRSRAEELIADFQRTVLFTDLADALSGASLVFQATTQGMGWSPTSERFGELEGMAHAALAGCASAAVMVDLVYTPRSTPWVCAARARGLVADDGLEMLVRQAAAAFSIWTGAGPEPSLIDAMRKAVSDIHLSRPSNL